MSRPTAVLLSCSDLSPCLSAVDSQDVVTDAVEFKRFDLSTVKKEELEFHSDFTLKLSAGQGAGRNGRTSSAAIILAAALSYCQTHAGNRLAIACIPC